MIIYLAGKSLSRSSDTTRKVSGPLPPFPIRSCFRWGLPSRPVARTAGTLLPYRSTLTVFTAVFFSMALSLGLPPPDVIRHPAL